MQIVLVGNRVVAHGEDCFLCMGGTVVCEETGRSYSNATVAEVDAIPADIDSVGYEYHAGVFVPCAPYGKGTGNLAVVCNDDCKAIKDSGILSSEVVLVKKLPRYTKKTVVNPAYGKAVGDTVSLNVNGVATDFIVVHSGNPDTSIYHESCDGIWLMSKNLDSKLAHGSVSYKSSAVNTYLNGTYYSYFDNATKALFKTVTIPYATAGNSGKSYTLDSGYETIIFIPSRAEVGLANDRVDGSAWAYFDGADASVRVAKYDGTNTDWWLRSPSATNTTMMAKIGTDGATVNISAANTYGVRPSMVLFNEAEITYYEDEEGTLYTEQEYDTLLANALDEVVGIPSSQIVGRVQIATGSYTGTGKYGSSNENSLAFDFKPAVVFVYYAPTNNDHRFAMFPYGATSVRNMCFATGYTNAIASGMNCSWNGNTLSWYDANSAIVQMNAESQIGYYFAIG